MTEDDLGVIVQQLQAAESKRALADKHRAVLEEMEARHAREAADEEQADARLRAKVESDYKLRVSKHELDIKNKIAEFHQQLSRVRPQ
jgi:hypothetical protein